LFLRAQDYVNKALVRYAPETIGKFMAAQDCLITGKPEDLSHVLSPDDKYRNRLVQYVGDRLGKRTRGDVLKDTLDSLGARLRSRRSTSCARP